MRTLLGLVILTTLAAQASAQDVFASNGPADCRSAAAAENQLIRQNLAEIRKQESDINTQYHNDILSCDPMDRGCKQDAIARQRQAMRDLQIQRNNELNRHNKAMIDINTGCRNGVVSQTSQTQGAIQAQEVLTPQGKQLLFKLGAEMNAIANAPQGDPATEFVKGLADWAGSTLQFLAQKPGAPVEQMAQGIMTYLTNDNAANHRALLGAAQQAVRDFQQNPARFLGANLPNLLPLPGGKAKALERIAQVEKAATRVKELAQAEKAFAGAYNKAIQDAERWGTQQGAASCFAQNACFPQSLAEAELYKVGGPLGNGTPYRIRGAYGTDLAHTSEQITERLRPYGENFAPRRPGTYTPEQLDQIWQGNPIAMPGGPDQIRGILEREGIDSQGIVFAEHRPTLNQQPGVAPNHAFNVRNENGTVRFVDTTMPGADPLFTAAQVQRWWFFPIQ